MTRHAMARRDLAQARDFLGTDIHGMRTTRVKFTALWRCEHITHRPRDRRQVLGLGVEARDRVEEADRIRVQRVGKQLGFRPEFDEMRGIHHHDGIAGMDHHTQIVRDEDQGHVQTLNHAADELQDRGLDGDVERRGGLVGD